MANIQSRENYETLIDLQNRDNTPMLSVDEIALKHDRTLLYGYTIERHTWHVYLKDGVIYTVCYKFVGGETKHELVNDFCLLDRGRADVMVPSKRLYPERCDFDFCKLLISKGLHLPFTCYSPDVALLQWPDTYFGKTREDFGKF